MNDRSTEEKAAIKTNSEVIPEISLTEKTTKHFKIRQILSQGAIYFVLILLIIVSGLLSPYFLTTRNIMTLLKQTASLGIAAVGQTFVILSGGIDLSIASIMALMSVLAANMMAGNNALVLPIGIFCLVVATTIGLFNGLLVTKLKIPPFIATLGTILIVQGIRFLYTGGAPKGSIPPNLRVWGKGMLGVVPVPVILWLAIVVIVFVVLRWTVFGRRLHAVGGNPEAAHLSGVSVNGIRMAAYTLSGFFAGVAGLVLTGYIGVADNWLGQGYELSSIAAVVVGGTLLEGGKGSIWGTVAGVLIIMILFNLVLLLGLSEHTQRIVKGLVIILAVSLYARLQSRS